MIIIMIIIIIIVITIIIYIYIIFLYLFIYLFNILVQKFRFSNQPSCSKIMCQGFTKNCLIQGSGQCLSDCTTKLVPLN